MLCKLRGKLLGLAQSRDHWKGRYVAERRRAKELEAENRRMAKLLDGLASANRCEAWAEAWAMEQGEEVRCS